MSTHLTDAFTGTDGAPWAAARWATGLTPTGAARTLAGGWGRLRTGSGTSGRRVTAPVAAAVPADLEWAVRFRAAGAVYARLYVRGDATLATARGYFLEPAYGRAKVSLARSGAQGVDYTGGTVLASTSPGFTFTTGVEYQARFVVADVPTGVQLRAKVWPAAQPEPAAWTLEHTDTTAERITSTGAAGFAVDSPDPSAVFEVDDATLTDPTTTVTAPDTTAPATPTGVTANAGGPNLVTVAWPPADTDVASYRLLRDGLIVAPVVPTGTWDDRTVAPATSYEYTLSAVDEAGNRSGESDPATVTTPPVQPGGGTGTAFAVVQASPRAYGPVGAATTVTPALSGPPTPGHLLVAALGVDKGSGTISVTDGWTLAGEPYRATHVSQAVAYRVATGDPADLACPFTWTAPRGALAVLLETNQTVTGPPDVTVAPNPANDDTVTSLTVNGGSATAPGFALAVVSVDTDTTASWHTQLPAWSGGFIQAHAAITTNSTTASDVDVNTGGSCVVLAVKPLASGDPATTTATWSTPDQATARVLRFGTVDALAGAATVNRVSGAVTPTSAVVAYVVRNAASVRLVAATNEALTTGVVTGPAVTPDAQGAVKLPVTGLSPDTRYYYAAVIDGQTMTTHRGQLYTHPSAAPTSFTFAFGSCLRTDLVGDIFDDIRAANPRLFLEIGDWGYPNFSTNNVTNFRNHYSTMLGKAKIDAAAAAFPFDYTWDDHDFGPDNSDGGSATRPATNQAYRERWPHYALPSSTGIGCYHTFTYGPDVRFIVLDVRSHRSKASNTDNSSKTMLGSEQKSWLKATLNAAQESLIFVVTAVGWVGSGGEHWGAYTTERTELVNFCTANNRRHANRMIFLAGDMHALAVNTGADSSKPSPGSIPILHAAPLGQAGSSKGGPYTHGPVQGSTSNGQFGLVTVTRSGSSYQVRFRGRNQSGTDVIDTTLTKAALDQVPTGPVEPNTSPFYIRVNGRWVQAAATPQQGPGIFVKVGSEWKPALLRAGTGPGGAGAGQYQANYPTTY